MLSTLFQCSTAPTRKVCSIIQVKNAFLRNLIFQYTNPLPFETEPHSIHTIPLLREHLDYCLYYISYKIMKKLHHRLNSTSFLTLLKLSTQEYSIGQSTHQRYN